jgi:hypothetical protein
VCIELANFEWSMAALNASLPAKEPWPTPLGGLCEGSVDNLDQLEVRRHAEKLFSLNIARAVRARFRIMDSKEMRGTLMSLRISASRKRLRAL